MIENDRQINVKIRHKDHWNSDKTTKQKKQWGKFHIDGQTQ